MKLWRSRRPAEPSLVHHSPVLGAGILKRLVLKGVGGITLSPVGHVLAAWVPEAKGVPGFVGEFFVLGSPSHPRYPML